MDVNIFDGSARKKYRITTIKISNVTKDRLDHLRRYRRETYEETVQTILEILNICRTNPEEASLKLLQIDRERKRNLGAISKEKPVNESEYRQSLASQKQRFHSHK